jgi:hypothetical protein
VAGWLITMKSTSMLVRGSKTLFRPNTCRLVMWTAVLFKRLIRLTCLVLLSVIFLPALAVGHTR